MLKADQPIYRDPDIRSKGAWLWLAQCQWWGGGWRAAGGMTRDYQFCELSEPIATNSFCAVLARPITSVWDQLLRFEKLVVAVGYIYIHISRRLGSRVL